MNSKIKNFDCESHLHHHWLDDDIRHTDGEMHEKKLDSKEKKIKIILRNGHLPLLRRKRSCTNKYNGSLLKERRLDTHYPPITPITHHPPITHPSSHLLVHFIFLTGIHPTLRSLDAKLILHTAMPQRKLPFL